MKVYVLYIEYMENNMVYPDITLYYNLEDVKADFYNLIEQIKLIREDKDNLETMYDDYYKSYCSNDDYISITFFEKEIK